MLCLIALLLASTCQCQHAGSLVALSQRGVSTVSMIAQGIA